VKQSIDFRSKIKCLIYDINASTRAMRSIAIFIELLPGACKRA